MEPICATFLNPIFLIFVRVRFQLELGLYLSTVNCDIFGFCLAPLQLNHSTSASFEFPMISIKNFFAVDIKNYITSHFKKISLKHLIKQKVYLAVEKYFSFLNTPAAFLSLTHHSPETQKTLSLEGQEDSTQIYLYLNQNFKPVPSNHFKHTPIQNIKCPKNTKNACADIVFSPAIIYEV